MTNSFRESLDATHSFPGLYVLKIIGRNSPVFVESVVQVLQSELGLQDSYEPALRETPGGRHLSAAFTLRVDSSEQVICLYEQLKSLTDVVMVL